MIGNFTGISATPASNWNCSVSGHSGTCTYPGYGAIAAGQVLGTITITYHSWALANFTNCAGVGLTINAPLQETNLPNNNSCVTVTNIKLKAACPDGRPVPKSGRCPVAPIECKLGTNEERNDQGQCVCKSGYERDKSGRCLEPSNPADECKKKGWVWDGKNCQPPASPADECKKKGWVWNGERCLPPQNPAEDCKKKGWVWDGKNCQPPASPADECKKKGWVWNGERCLPPQNPAEDCKKKGWVWDGKNCQPPGEPRRRVQEEGLGLERRTLPAATEPGRRLQEEGLGVGWQELPAAGERCPEVTSPGPLADPTMRKKLPSACRRSVICGHRSSAAPLHLRPSAQSGP